MSRSIKTNMRIQGEKKGAWDLSRLRLIFVDDYRPYHPIMRALLYGLNIRSFQFYDDAERSLADIERNPPDFLVVDDSIKPFDGVEMCMRLRGGGPSIRFLPILLITSLPSVSLVERARDAGAHAVLAKPMSLKSLYSRITMILQERRPFIETDEYFGPDRRRRDLPFDGSNRRKGGGARSSSGLDEGHAETPGPVQAGADAA